MRPEMQEINLSFNAARWEGLAAVGDAYADARAAVRAGGMGGAYNSASSASGSTAGCHCQCGWLGSIVVACPLLEELDLSYNLLGDLGMYSQKS